MDVVIPIVFPDYLISVSTPPVKIEVPDLLPFVDVAPDVVRIPATKNKLPELGHAGVLFINGRRGVTKYYEYGRYDRAQLGRTRRIPIPNVSGGGMKDVKGLTRVLRTISFKAGQNGRIQGVYIEVDNKFPMMLKRARQWVAWNKMASQKPYSLTSRSCMHFSKDIVESAEVKTPTIVDPRPNSYIEEMRFIFPPLDYAPSGNRLVVKGVAGFEL